MRRSELAAGWLPGLLLLGAILCPPGGASRPPAQESPPGSETKEHWFQYFRGQQQVGVLKVEVSRDADRLILRDLLVVFDHEQEIQVQSEYRYRGTGRALRADRVSVGVTRGDEFWLDGSLKFENEQVLEAFRTTRDGELTERRLPAVALPLVTFSGLPILAPLLLDGPGEIEVMFPALPRGLRGPVLESPVPVYTLTRTAAEDFEYRLRGTRPQDKRATVAKTENGEVTEILLEPQFRFLRSRRGICMGWYLKRAKKAEGGTELGSPPAEKEQKKPDGG